MLSKRLICAAMLLAGSSLLCATQGYAQTPPHGHAPSHGGPPGGHPGPHGAPHFTFAHRDFGHFTADEHARWIGGRWNHGYHNGRFGWWWFAGGAWYFYNAPIYPYPGYVSDDYVDADDYGAPGQFWYYCQNPPGYYPYIQRCGMPWQPVPAGAPPSGAYGPQQGQGYGPPPGANSGPPDDQPPPGYDNGPGPGDQPPPGYQGPGPGGPGPGNQGPPGYPPGYQNQGPGNQPPPGPGPGAPPPPPNN
jgi:hypothetical protein